MQFADESSLQETFDTLRSCIHWDSAEGVNLGSAQSLTLAAVVKHRLDSLLRSKPKFLLTFRIMFADPFRSALTR